MRKLNIKKESYTNVYKKWKLEKGKPDKVILSEFIGYHVEKHDVYPRPFQINGQNYIGANYIAYCARTGKERIVIIKEKLPENWGEFSSPNVGWEYNKTPILDDIPYHHNDFPEEIKQNRLSSNREVVNKRLALKIKESSDFVKKLKILISRKDINKNLKKGLALYLLHYSNPTKITQNTFKKWVNSSQTDYKTMSKILEWD